MFEYWYQRAMSKHKHISQIEFAKLQRMALLYEPQIISPKIFLFKQKWPYIFILETEAILRG